MNSKDFGVCKMSEEYVAALPIAYFYTQGWSCLFLIFFVLIICTQQLI